MKAGLTLIGMLGMMASGVWATPADDARERERIAEERTQVEAHFSTQEQACMARFFATSCVDKVQRDRRDALARLNQQEALLNQAQRQRRAQERTAAIREKISANEQAGGSTLPSDRALNGVAPAEASASEARSSPALTKRPPQAVIDQTKELQRREQEKAEEATMAARRVKAQREKTAAAVAHKAAVQARNAQQATSGRAPAAGLPAPSGAARETNDPQH